MESTITFKRDNKNVKKSLHPEIGVFLIYASRQFKISPMQFQRYYTKLYLKILVDILLQNLKQRKLNRFVMIHNRFG